MGTEQSPRDPQRRVLHASCSCPGVADGFANLVITKLPDGRIELDLHATGQCRVTLGEDAARVLRDALIAWLP